MRRNPKSLTLLCLFTLIIGIPSLQAQWVEDGVAICTAMYDQEEPRIISDGAGGAIITWQDNRSGTGDIYALNIDASGTAQWTVDGIAICSAANTQSEPQIISDDAGGTIITWYDYRSGSNGDVYAQRIDASGTAQWTPDGVAACTATGTQTEQQITADGAGGAIISWIDLRNGKYDIYAQRIDANGTAVWTADGVAICTTTGMKSAPQITSDGAGGAIITWQDYYSGNWDIYAQRVNADSVVQWTADGVAICAATGHQYAPHLTPDGAGGAVITWHDQRVSPFDIYAQRIDDEGTVLWTTDGEAICTASGGQQHPRIIPDGSGGAIIAWEDERSGAYTDVRIQRIDELGAAQWTENGIAIYRTTNNSRNNPGLTPDGAGGAIVAWTEDVGQNMAVYAQRIDADGWARWEIGCVAICTAPDERWYPQLTSDGSGGAIITWADYRSGSYADIYAQKVDRWGHAGYYYPAPYFSSIKDVPNDQGGKLNLQWKRSCADTLPNSEITHYSLWRLLSETEMGGLIETDLKPLEELDITPEFEATAIRFLLSGSAYAWEWIANVPARHSETYALTIESLYDSMGTDPRWQHFVVTAHTEDLVTYYDSPIDSGYSVDNLAPVPPEGLAGIQSLAPQGLHLSWLPNTESDLSYYTVHRGDNEFFTPDATNLVSTTPDTVLIDTEWVCTDYIFYKLAAVDVHGNTGQYALLRPEDINVGTLLQSFTALPVRSWIEISWTLSEVGEDMEFFVLRAEGADGKFNELFSPEIMGESLSFTFRDESCEPGTGYRYRVDVMDEDGRRVLFETDRIFTPVMPLTLYQNHPNPFNPSTTIRYYLPEKSRVTLEIYDISGKRIASLVNNEQPKGFHEKEWNGLHEQGIPVVSGVYIYRLKAGKEMISRKMVLLR